jgi:hypothetical protein
MFSAAISRENLIAVVRIEFFLEKGLAKKSAIVNPFT